MPDDLQTMPSSFSPEALRERYRIEREKRLRPDGARQYRELSEAFPGQAALMPDAFRQPREALVEETDVAIVGAGFGGLLTAARLRQAGVGAFRVIDKGEDFGGTWYWNRYPGAACDVESYIYLPMLEETGYQPTERYAKASEIFAYCQLLAKRFDLYDRALFGTEVTDLSWDEATSRWHVTTDRGDRIAAKFAVVAGGVLHKPKLPGIPGLGSFAGHHFHTSRWDYGYTGGGPGSLMTGLADKKVGIIGTGATAIQAIPPLAESAGHLYVFQRTPSGVGVRGNRPTDAAWYGSLPPGWQRDRLRRFTHIVAGGHADHDPIDDGWTQLFRSQIAAIASNPERAEEARQLVDYENMEAVRARVDAVVRDPATAEALKPYYNQMCKRPCFHDGFLEVFNRPNVTLVDTNGKGVERITPAGVVANGREFQLDCLIYASGFEVSTAYTRRLGFDIHGRGGIPISRAWAAGAATLHGFMSRGFPNLLKISTTQGGQGINFAHVLDEASVHVAYIVRKALDMDAATVEPTEVAQRAWLDVIMGQLRTLGSFHQECTPGYFNNEGSQEPGNIADASFMGNAIDFFDICEGWRRDDSLAGLEIVRREGDGAGD